MPCGCANNNEAMDMPKLKPMCIIFWMATIVITGFFFGLGWITAANIFSRRG